MENYSNGLRRWVRFLRCCPIIVVISSSRPLCYPPQGSTMFGFLGFMLVLLLLANYFPNQTVAFIFALIFDNFARERDVKSFRKKLLT